MSGEENSLTPTNPGIRQERHSEQEGRYFAEALIDTIQEGLLVLDTSLRVETVVSGLGARVWTTTNEDVISCCPNIR